jgi:hypothetical protein
LRNGIYDRAAKKQPPAPRPAQQSGRRGRKEGRKPAPQPLEDMNFQTVRNYG